MEDILNIVKGSLREPAANLTTNGHQANQEMQVDAVVYSEYQDGYEGGAEQWDYDANEIVLDDHGEGVGIEGDLDVDDD